MFKFCLISFEMVWLKTCASFFFFKFFFHKRKDQWARKKWKWIKPKRETKKCKKTIKHWRRKLNRQLEKLEKKVRRSNLRFLLFYKSNNKKYGEINLKTNLKNKINEKKTWTGKQSKVCKRTCTKRRERAMARKKVGRTTVITHD